MAPRKTREIDKALKQKGFEPDQTHHSMYWLHVGGKKTSVRTRLSHGANEYDDRLLAQVANQMKIRRHQLEDFIDCTLSGQAYAALLIEQGMSGVRTRAVKAPANEARARDSPTLGACAAEGESD